VVFEAGVQLGVDLGSQFVAPREFELLGEERQLLKHAFAGLARDEFVDGGEQLFRRQWLVLRDGVGLFVDAAFEQGSQFAEPLERREDAFIFRVLERGVDRRHRGEAEFGAGRLLQGDGGAGHGVKQFHIASGAFERGVDRIDHRLRFARGPR